MSDSIFDSFKVKDIVFMALISAVALCTAAVMAIVAHIYIYGLAQLVTAFQFAFFSAIALMKVRKVGTLFIFALFTGLFELFMAPVMFISSVLTGLILELLVVLIFRNYKNSVNPVFFASMLFIPCTMPFNLIYYRLFSKEMWDLFFASGFKMLSIVFITGSFVVAALGSFLGIKVSKELLKAGVLK
ncbi:MptD family putative ECF transporter S component [Treponema sp.]|uniref:MptD family putative ECF transporter S component n=1 Tax=Treponema sp. TaxID=166 RepID=UPI0025EB9D6C|nr:MptD family putative ECF transporter S component [Treponema sp.]MCR5217067.1 MptD family putative ECF transporter S component [Treponema sp.]